MPIQGKNARVEFFFNTDYLKAGDLSIDGGIDFKDRGEIPHVEEGTVLLVGTDTQKIIGETQKLISDINYYNEMSLLHNPYGDGKACNRIVDFIKNINIA